MKLTLVPTPIGNLEDITLRAISVLKSAHIILAEDKRTSGQLLKYLGISKPMLSYHNFNEHRTVLGLVERMKNGESMALMSDAGTPAISDPGFLLLREAIKNNITVECLPGPTAFVPALVNSGLPMERFTFEGFLPHKKGRQSKINELKDEPRTMIFYESPYRLLKTLEQFIACFGPTRPASISRELTKIYEENLRGTLQSLFTHFSNNPVRGEFVIVVGGKVMEDDTPTL